jgi:hypothetical protein
MIPWLKLAEQANKRGAYVSNLKHRKLREPKHFLAYCKLNEEYERMSSIWNFCICRYRESKEKQQSLTH